MSYRILTIMFTSVVSVLCLSANTSAVNSQDCLKAATTQMELNQCSGVEYAEADAELNRVYMLIQTVYKEDTEFLRKLMNAQKAWIQLRDADLAMKYPRGHFGSAYPMCAAGYETQLTLQRIAFLKQWLVGTEEGDVCGGSQMLQSQINERLIDEYRM